MAAARNLQARKTIRNTNLDTGMMTPGMQRILGTTPPEETGLAGARVPQGPAPVEGPTPTGLEGQVPNAQQVIDNAIGAALKRPIVQQPMPSIANSSKDINGPVVIDPAIPAEYHQPLAVHETVEQELMARGMPYDQAHPIATQAERTVAEHMGINWDDYSAFMAKVAPQIEAQKIMPDAWQNLNLHEDPYDAIGHHTDKDIAADFRQDISEPALGQAPENAPVSTPEAGTPAEGGKAPDFNEIPDFLRRQPPGAQAAIQTSQAMRRGNMPPDLTAASSALLSKFRRMFGDTTAIPNAIHPDPNNGLSPNATPSARAYTDSLYDRFNIMKTRAANAQQSLENVFMKAPELSDADWTAIGKAWTQKTEDQLPANLQEGYKFFTDTIVPQQRKLLADVQELDPKNTLGMDRIHEGFLRRFLPRQRESDVIDRGDDVLTGRQMLGWDPAIARRDFKNAVQVDADGKPIDGAQPILIKDNGDGTATAWTNKTPTPFTYETGEEGGNIRDVGTTFTAQSKGSQPLRYVTDHADAHDIMAQGIKDEVTGQPLNYNTNALTASLASSEGLMKARDTLKLLQDIKTDPDYKQMFTTSEAKARNEWGGLYRTNLPQFASRAGEPLYMPESVSHALNDFYAPGYHTPAGLDRAASALIKTMYVPGFVIHDLNEGVQWAIGKPWHAPEAWRGLLEDFPEATKDVLSQGPIQQEIRDNGGNTQLYSVLSEQRRNEIFRKAGQDMVKESKFWKPIADRFDMNVPQLAQNVYNASRKAMWTINDMLYTQQYMTYKRMGLSPAEAVEKTQQFISDYRINDQVLGQRWLSKLFNTPGLSLFGRFHAGLYKSWGITVDNLTKGGFDPKAATAERKEGISQLMAAGIVGMFVFPYLLNPIARGITGNPDAEFGQRGMLTIPTALSKIATGQAGYETAMPNLYTPSLPISAAMGAVRNLDWTGQPIIPRADLRNPANAVRAGLQGADYLGKALVPPYSSLASAAAEKGTTPGRVAGKLLTGNLGIKNPSQASVNYMNRIQQNNARIQKEHRKGPLEQVYGKLTGQQ